MEKVANSEDKFVGILSKVSLAKIKDRTSRDCIKEYEFELNYISMTFSYIHICKCNEDFETKFVKKSYGYKQIYKFTLQLTEDEEWYCYYFLNHKHCFKLILENKSWIFLCKTFTDLKAWSEKFKKFFDKREAILKYLKHRDKFIYDQQFIQECHFVQRYLETFSHSFVQKEKRGRKSKIRHFSADYIFLKSKELSKTLYIPSSRRISNPVRYCQSKLLKKESQAIMKNFRISRLLEKHPFRKISQFLQVNSDLLGKYLMKCIGKKIQAFAVQCKNIQGQERQSQVKQEQLDEEWEINMPLESQPTILGERNDINENPNEIPGMEDLFKLFHIK